MSFGTKVRKTRNKYGLTQQEFADIVRISKGTLASLERGYTTEWAESAIRIKESGMLDEEKAQEIVRELHLKRVRKRDKYRIPNIPNFYEKLNSLCDKDGSLAVDINHPELQELRMAIGGDRHMEKKAYNN